MPPRTPEEVRKTKVAYARRIVESRLKELADHLFLPGMKLTFIMRNPGYPDGTMIVTDEEASSDIIETIQKTWEKKE